MHQFADFRVPAVCTIHIQDMFSIVEKLSIRIQTDPFNAIEGFSFLESIILCNEDRVFLTSQKINSQSGLEHHFSRITPTPHRLHPSHPMMHIVRSPLSP